MEKRGWSCDDMNRQPTENPGYVLDAPGTQGTEEDQGRDG